MHASLIDRCMSAGGGHPDGLHGGHQASRGRAARTGHRLRRGLLERRAAGLRQVDGMPREPRVRFGGAESERTTREPPSRPETHQQVRAGQPAREGTRRQPPGPLVRVHTEVLAGPAGRGQQQAPRRSPTGSNSQRGGTAARQRAEPPTSPSAGTPPRGRVRHPFRV